MPRIVVASQNPVKISAVRRAFQRSFPDQSWQVASLSVPSGVPDQPRTDDEAHRGAKNRAENARLESPDADYWVGIEGGIDHIQGSMVAFAWIVALSSQQQGSARTAVFTLPAAVAALVEDGLELGHADDRVFGRDNSKQKSGAVGLLTGDVVTRTSLYEQAVILAVIPFRNPDLY
jgi:inosine/xanthosine triphosphatase